MALTGDVTVVVVTYNRKDLLVRCLDALRQQTLVPARIVVVDNASSDRTRELLAESRWFSLPGFTYSRLPENTGGAGGFHAGLDLAVNKHARWVWLMDDDALPEPTALAELMLIASDPGNVYGSLAVDGDLLSWRLSVRGLPSDGVARERVTRTEALPENLEVEFLPFLGFLIHTDLVGRIGLPEQGFFIAADDVEYSLRARRAGARIIVATRSRLRHPASDGYAVSLFGQEILCLSLPPWKRYYDTRNRLLVARRYHGAELVYKTIPGTLVRLFTVLWFEPNRLAQLRAFVGGIVDGVLGRQGRRHELWGIGK